MHLSHSMLQIAEGHWLVILGCHAGALQPSGPRMPYPGLAALPQYMYSQAALPGASYSQAQPALRQYAVATHHAMQQHSYGHSAAAAAMGDGPGKGQAGGGDDVAQRLQRIEALAEEIARAQVCAESLYLKQISIQPKR